MQDRYAGEQEPWPPEPGAVHVQVWRDPDDARPTSILLAHPATPFVRPASLDNEVAVQQAAHEYLVAASRVFDLPLPQWWLLAVDPEREPHPGFGWLAVFRPVDDTAPRPIASVLVENGRRNRPTSRTLVLLAAERHGDFVPGSEFGVRVVVHALPQTNGIALIRITGFSASLPFGIYRSETGDDLLLNVAERVDTFRAFLERFSVTIADELSLRAESIFFRGLRVARSGGGFAAVEFKGRGLSTAEGAEPFEFIAQGTASDALHEASLLSYHKTPLSACMATPALPREARVFRRDPASHDTPGPWARRRPTRDEAAFDPSRELELERVPLRLHRRLNVVQTWYVLGDNPNGPSGGIKQVPLPDAAMPVRSNDFTAVSTFRNVRQLFERFAIYQIPPLDFFNHARLPLIAHYRSGVRPGWGKNGQTINGRVLPEGWPVGAVVAPTISDRPILHLHLALGNLSTRARKPWNGVARSPAEPLGFATDPRWLWHEISHVMLMAALGELELRFAHSMGDGLAAIVADPRSALADAVRWRGYTFPWVFVPRHHDRCVLHGWGWSGELGRPLREVPDSERLRQKAYLTEQILSTSLFRMYRCLGGDTVLPAASGPDPKAREQASDYAVYLIMEALRLLGNPGAVPASRVDLFVAALINADEQTETETFPPGARSADRVPWTGGCAHKAIRWAFEAQGLYAAAGVFHAPGLPPNVDIFVPDGRNTTEDFPDAQVSHNAGSYVPVSLDWADLIAAPPGVLVPKWFAGPGAMQLTNGDMEVTVGNRGTFTAANVTVRLWHLAWAAGQPPLWDRTVWIDAGIAAPQDIPAGATRVFAGFALPNTPGRHLVLAEAGCATDPANSDPATLLPCSRRPTPLSELVAMDNNLGLRVIEVP